MLTCFAFPKSIYKPIICMSFSVYYVVHNKVLYLQIPVPEP